MAVKKSLSCSDELLCYEEVFQFHIQLDTKSYKYLSVTVTSDLNWDKRISIIFQMSEKFEITWLNSLATLLY